MKSIEEAKEEIAKVIVGQEELIDALFIALLSGGHLLIEGVPGVAKTTAAKTFAKVLGLTFSRIQFTPDLLPSDIVGAQIYNPKSHTFEIKKGPIFGNIILADEINRAPAKVQSALLEAMQEKQVTIGEETFALPDPFIVIATQNPIEEEGVFVLPEAQLDRFMMKALVGIGSAQEEVEILRQSLQRERIEPQTVLDHETIIKLQTLAKEVHVDEELMEYMVSIVRATREPKAFGLEQWQSRVAHGAGLRAGLSLLEASKAYALLQGRDYVMPADIAMVAAPVLRHRIKLSFEALSRNLDSDALIAQAIEKVSVP